jgi:type IV secretory pathway VirB10-like protein
MIENINPLPSGIRKINKRMVVSILSFVFFVLLGVLFIMTIAEKQSSQKKSAYEESASTYISKDSINVETLQLLPDGYSDIKQQSPKDTSPEPQKNESKRPPEKVYLPGTEVPTAKKDPTGVKEQKISSKELSAQNYLPTASGQDIRPGASYQYRSQEEIEKEKALKSQLLFFGSGKNKKIKKDETINTQLHANAKKQRQAIMSDLIDHIQPSQSLSETKVDQQSKKAFFESNNQGAVYLNQRIQDPVSPYQLMAGTVLPAVLISGINSDLPGHIIAQIRENVFDTVHGRYLLVPQGTKLLGSYDNMVSWGQDKVMLVWSRLIMPDGATIVLDNMPGVDIMGYAGLKDRVNNHYMKIASAILMSTFLSVGTRRLAGEINDNDPTFAQEMTSSASADINQAGQKIVTRHLNVPPTLEIRPGFPFNVMVNKDIILRPYEQ